MAFSFLLKFFSFVSHSSSFAACLNLSNWDWVFSVMYRLYVDEVGHTQVKNLEKDSQKYLSLTGVAMQISHARDALEPALNRIKAEIFNQDPDFPMCFHRKEILGYKGSYQILRDEAVCKAFDDAIMNVFTETEYVVITALIDKPWMLRQELSLIHI